jgi:hypothetical protein
LIATSVSHGKGDRKVIEMKVTKLFKDDASGGNGCPTVYLGETGELVIQGSQLDAETFAELENVLPGESAVRIAPGIIIGAIQRYQSQDSVE